MNPYYGIRRFSPYLGVIQVIDVGDACAYSGNGRSWRIRQRTASGYFRWGATLVSGDDTSRVRIVNGDNLLEALKNRPPVPFPMRDKYELWLLNKKTGEPMALLKTCYKADDMDEVNDPHWRPFALADKGFASETLDQLEQGSAIRGRRTPHRDRLESLVNQASRPLPVAQWIERRADGSGVGCEGLRVEQDRVGRHYPAAVFPELLISESWERPEEQALVNDYHDWLASQLLAHQNIGTGTRARLERAVCRRPQGLLNAYPLIPEILDEDALDVAMVSARLMSAG